MRRTVWCAVLGLWIAGGCAADAGLAFRSPDGAPVVPDAGPPVPPPDASTRPDASCPAGSPTTLSGRVTFPNGELPVAGAVVYVQHGAELPPHLGDCGECIDLSATLAHTTTGPYGRFELSPPPGTHYIVVEKGKLRRGIETAVTACATNDLGDALRLPRSAAEGSVPRIAVLGGEWDHMEQVVRKLGLDESVFQVFPAASPEARSLFSSPEALAAYDIVFVNCGAPIGEELLFSEPRARDNLRSFLEAGGRVYVTDLAYNLIEQAFPERVDFSATADGLTAAAEPIGMHDDGRMAGDATIHDETLGAWMVASGAIAGPDRVPISSGVYGLVIMDRVAEGSVRTWVSGPVEPMAWGSGGPSERPLTVTFEHGCGRALYTSYHTEDVPSGGWTGPGGLTPQEMVLAYLILEIGECIEEPTLF